MIFKFIKHLLFPQKKYTKKYVDKQMLLLEEMGLLIGYIQDKRPNLNYYINGELAWVIYERHAILWEINKRRIEAGKVTIDLERFKKAENCAVGHIDYSHKLALYARDLINED